MIKLPEIFVLEEDRIRDEVARCKASRVLIQLPEGLRSAAHQIASIVEEAGALAIVSADPCYGACDLALNEARILSADLLIHFGHSESKLFNHPFNLPVIFVEAKAQVNVRGAVEDALRYLNDWGKIGLATVVQHADSLNEAKEILERAGKKVYIGCEPGLKYPGQVLGCNYKNAKSIRDLVDAFLIISSGLFHATGLFLATLKPTVAADPFEGKAIRVDDEAKTVINKRWMDICEASDARRWGVIIGLKSGQLNFEAALGIKGDLEAHGRKAILLAIREITPEILGGFPQIEAYVNTACPRISICETHKFSRPVLTPREVHVALGDLKWEEYLHAGIL
jgi:2-(3-amino-3-carboxypropyl)histidine synthase